MRKIRYRIGDKKERSLVIQAEKIGLLAVGVRYKAVPSTYLSLKAKISAAAGEDLKLATSGNEKKCHCHKRRRKKSLLWKMEDFRIKILYIY